MIAQLMRNGLFTVDFHTHTDRKSPLPFQENVLRIVSTPISEAAAAPQPGIVQTLELHPWSGDKFTPEFAALAQDERFIGIGEVGLDRLRGKLPLEEQISTFLQTVEAAGKLHKPLTIHCVKCYSELLELYKKKRWHVPTVIHYFCSKLPLARQLWEQTPFYLSLPPCVPPQILEFLQHNPEYRSRIVLETDDPTGDIIQHYRYVAGKLGLTFDELQALMYQQFLRIYHEQHP